MIDAKTEKIITLAAAARLMPRRRAGKNCSVSTLYRWTSRGCRGTVLESLQIGATRCTSEEALARFFQRLTSIGIDASIANRARPEVLLQQTKRIDAALDRLGLV